MKFLTFLTFLVIAVKRDWYVNGGSSIVGRPWSDWQVHRRKINEVGRARYNTSPCRRFLRCATIMRLAFCVRLLNQLLDTGLF